MANLKLIIAYDGTRYFGWQKTKMGPSIEGVLQEILEKVTQHPIKLQAASRTDAGVHAEGQVVNFIVQGNQPELSQFQLSLNQLLPPDMAVLSVEQMPDSFHPTLDARIKEYHYCATLARFQWPQHRMYSWHFPYPVDLTLMEKGSRYLIGEHDFSAFTNVNNEEPPDYTRTIESIDFCELGGGKVVIIIRGHQFLYRMARNLVGTLLYAGCGKLDVDLIPEVMESRDRKMAGVTAPSHGLFLHKVEY
ncbi:MAG: tRNA pseudouridine synthase A [Chlamydiae bacterium]|nr:tRNA pseudouridine synthase A [Chlamydiota bacterium]